MPIKIPDKLPARRILLKESIDVIDTSLARKQDIRPLKFLLLNLMPQKKSTEIQFARLIGVSPLQIELTLMTTKTYKPKNTENDYLIEFYKTLDDVKNNFYDVLIITGAPVEQLPFQNVKYWNELVDILEWSKKNIFRRIGICWGAQVLLKVFHDIEKHQLPKKKFGVFNHELSINNNRLLHGFTDFFPMPVSRYTENKQKDITEKGLEILAISDKSGVGMVRCPKSKDLFILNHLEYDANTLNEEFLRDKIDNVEVLKPENYFPENDMNKKPINVWRPFAFLLFGNFINEVYQEVPFDLKKLKFS